MTNKQLKVGLVTMAPFPIGNVSTIRFTSYLEALVKRGISSKVIIYTPTSMAKHINVKQGTFRGIHFEFASKITWGRYCNILVKIYYLIIGVFSTLNIIRKSKINTVILYGDNPAIVYLLLKIGSKVLGFKLFGDRSEYPTYRQRESKIKLLIYKLKNSLLDGLIVMTKELDDYYKKILKHNKNTFLLPMTMDLQRFDNIFRYKCDSYIAVVFGTHNRDGLLESIKSYFLYKDMGGKYGLKIIGDFDSMPNKSELQHLVDSSKYRIDILGKKSITEVPELLANARCLMTTPNSYISGGFPTKIGEYLLSGVPIVSTRVGELGNYLTDNKDIFFVKAGDINGIAEKLIWVENNQEYANQVAINGIDTVKRFFSAESYAEELESFLRS